jgi:hypothetical protein
MQRTYQILEDGNLLGQKGIGQLLDEPPNIIFNANPSRGF